MRRGKEVLDNKKCGKRSRKRGKLEMWKRSKESERQVKTGKEGKKRKQEEMMEN